MKETSTVKLQRELQKYANRKKEVLPQRVFFALIGKDIQKDFKKIYEIRSKSLEFGWGVFFRCLFLEKFGIIGKEPFSSVQKKTWVWLPTWNGVVPIVFALPLSNLSNTRPRSLTASLPLKNDGRLEDFRLSFWGPVYIFRGKLAGHNSCQKPGVKKKLDQGSKLFE